MKSQEITSSLQVIMSKRKIYLYSSIFLAFFIWFLSTKEEKDASFTEHAKVAIREAGHKLLLTGNDSTSLILPVIEIESTKYLLSFGDVLTFLPNDLVKIVKESFKRAELPEHYRVSVIQCKDDEVAYSYEMSANKENTIIPCSGRSLPTNCYTIEVLFTKTSIAFLQKQIILYVLMLIVLVFLTDLFLNRKKLPFSLEDNNGNYLEIGSFQFFPDQNKLVKSKEEINLSKKECELLSIFVSNQNQIIKREVLTKRVWEDNGVVVGRSLDTYISKLRKKLKNDAKIKLINVHGVGYKLEIN